MNAKPGLKFLLTAIAILCLAVLCVPQTAQAANGTWNVSTDGAWALDSNWNPAAAPGSTSSTTNTDTATFGNVITANRTITLDANRNISGINFSANSFAYTLSGGNLLLTNGGIIQTSAGGSGHTATISSAIEIQGVGGNASFTAGSSTATRLLTVTGNVTGVSTSGNTTALTLNGANAGANAVGGIIGDGSSGGKVSVVKSGAGAWNLNGLNTFTGGLEITQGTLSTGGSGNFGANGNTITLGSSDVNSANTILLRQGNGVDGNTYNMIVRSTDNAAATRSINSAVSASRTLNANVQIGDATGAINSLTLGSNIDLRGAISQSGINQGNLIIDTSTITDARIGGSTNNTFTGNTTVQGGNLILSKTGVSTVAVAGNLIIGTSTTIGNTTVRIDGAFSNGGAQLASTSVVSFGGPGINTFVFNNSFNSVLNLAGLNSASGINAVVGAIDTGTTTHRLNLAGSGNYSFAGIIRNSSSGSGSTRTVAVTKAGSGTQTFAGTNTYTGTTLVTGGTLIISGSIANSASTVGSTATLQMAGGSAGAVTVNNGGSLIGNGTVGATIINSGGLLSPGNSPGSLSLGSSNLTINSGGNVTMEITGLTGGTFDEVININTFTLGGNLTVNFTGTYAVGNSWDLFGFTSKTGNFSNLAFTGAYVGTLGLTGEIWRGTVGGLDWEFDQSSGNLSVIPEPSTWMLLGFGLAFILRRIRRLGQHRA